MCPISTLFRVFITHLVHNTALHPPGGRCCFGSAADSRHIESSRRAMSVWGHLSPPGWEKQTEWLVEGIIIGSTGLCVSVTRARKLDLGYRRLEGCCHVTLLFGWFCVTLLYMSTKIIHFYSLIKSVSVLHVWGKHSLPYSLPFSHVTFKYHTYSFLVGPHDPAYNRQITFFPTLKLWEQDRTGNQWKVGGPEWK